ncbi:biosynthetic-type acetolactate synthase large subunit [Gracilibacillus kekensis]|uniref:Acetolactate synthase n=1 Tax=Gracilibacillus kekensis TaxID=1027249 RepID=A0A1M7QUQ5_9BACI|nr:biosynthetic-type acetolactate synthase large subunit [Gracilibacillus kekensis]SHN35567.1 acetolactate synthase, large subunit [Gracilibacillus kekensis]
MQRVQNTFQNQCGQLFIESFKNENCDTVFGSVYQSIFLNKEKGFHHQQLTHEQSIIHAADGYARATGKAGVAFVTTDFGITNAVTGISTAQIDGIPLLVFIQKNQYTDESLDVETITKPICKHYFHLKRPENISSIIEEANKLALSGRKGVVIIEFSSSLFMEESVITIQSKQLSSIERVEAQIPIKQLDNIIHQVHEAKKPILLIGGGVIRSGASSIVNDFIKKTQIPFTSTLMGLGAIGVENPLHLGMVGMHGTYAANRAVHQCDLLICLGIRFSDRITGKTKGFSPNSIKIQIEIDPAEVNKNVTVDLPVIGDIQKVLTMVVDRLADFHANHWGKQVIKWKKTSPQFSNSTNLLKPDEIIREVHRFSPENTVIATDVGQHQMWTALHYPFNRPRQLLTSGGFGTMGYGLPAAIGAAVSGKNHPVVCFTGDGSIQMNIQELYHVAKNKLNVKVIILRNGYLGMVRQWQQLFYKNKYSQVKITSPDFLSVAESFGISGYRATSYEETIKIIRKAFSNDQPALLDFVIEEEVNVYPIVPPGGNNTDALQSEDLSTLK